MRKGAVHTGDGAGLEAEPLLTTNVVQGVAVEDAAQQSRLTEAYRGFRNRLNDDDNIGGDLWQRLAAQGKSEEFERALNMLPGNISRKGYDARRLLAVLCCPTLFFSAYHCCFRTSFEVKKGEFAFVKDESDGEAKTVIMGPGVHYLSFYYELLEKHSFSSAPEFIESPLKDMGILTVNQGEIAHLINQSQHVILSPGVYKINTAIVKFQRKHSLDSFFIRIGPEKWVTIPQGYKGVAIDNHEGLIILDPGKQHHLSHASINFSKLVPMKVQNNRIVDDIAGSIKATGQVRREGGEYDPKWYVKMMTADGALVHMDVMLTWEVTDLELAATRVMDFMVAGDIGEDEAIAAADNSIDHLREIILQLAKGCLAAEVGKLSLTGDTSLATDLQEHHKRPIAAGSQLPSVPVEAGQMAMMPYHSSQFQMLSALKKEEAGIVETINAKIADFGVHVLEISIYSVSPPQAIQEQLKQQSEAKVQANTTLLAARAEREKQEIAAQATARALEIESESRAKARLVEAESNAKAKLLTAEAEAQSMQKIAEQLQEPNTARIATIRAAGEAGKQMVGDSAKLIYTDGSVLSSAMSLFNVFKEQHPQQESRQARP